MADGTVVLISIAGGKPDDGQPSTTVDEVKAVAGKGLEGDRYFGHDFDTQVTLIAAEAIDEMAEKGELKIAYEEARRNIVTRGVDLKSLVDKEFSVGGVAVRGTRLSEPCQHLASLTDEKILEGLVHNGGIKAQIVTDGQIRVGDIIRV